MNREPTTSDPLRMTPEEMEAMATTKAMKDAFLKREFGAMLRSLSVDATHKPCAYVRSVNGAGEQAVRITWRGGFPQIGQALYTAPVAQPQPAEHPGHPYAYHGIPDERAQPQVEPSDVAKRITQYLCAGGLFNPELANHDAVRDLLIDARDALSGAQPQVEPNAHDRQRIATLEAELISKQIQIDTLEMMRERDAPPLDHQAKKPPAPTASSSSGDSSSRTGATTSSTGVSIDAPVDTGEVSGG